MGEMTSCAGRLPSWLRLDWDGGIRSITSASVYPLIDQNRDVGDHCKSAISQLPCGRETCGQEEQTSKQRGAAFQTVRCWRGKMRSKQSMEAPEPGDFTLQSPTIPSTIFWHRYRYECVMLSSHVLLSYLATGSSPTILYIVLKPSLPIAPSHPIPPYNTDNPPNLHSPLPPLFFPRQLQ